MRHIYKLLYIAAAAVILCVFAGCPVSEPDDTVKITALQTVISKANSGDTITLSSYADITDYTATIDKPLTITGSDVMTDLGGATLTVASDGVSIQNIGKSDVVITSAVKGRCTISASSLNLLTVSGCLSGKNSSLLLDGTTVDSAVFCQDSEDSNPSYLGLEISNNVTIGSLTCSTYLSIIDKNSTDTNSVHNKISTLVIEPNTLSGSCVAALPSVTVNNKSDSIATVRFYDPAVTYRDIQAAVDCMVAKNDPASVVTRDFLIAACKYLLGDVIPGNIASDDYIGKRITDDATVDINNMFDTVTITFHNNLPDTKSESVTVIKNCTFLMPYADFTHTESDTHILYGYSKSSGSVNKKEYSVGQSVSFDANTDLYAVWMTKYTISYKDRDLTGDVTFDAWRDSNYKPWTDYTIEDNVVLPTAEEIAKTGYIFRGWYTDRGYTKPASDWAASTKQGDITLYAKWEYNVCISSILFRSGDRSMTVRWTAPDNADIAKIRIACDSDTKTEVTSDAGKDGSYAFGSLVNGQSYTCELRAVDNKGNENEPVSITNYCGSYIDNSGTLYLKGQKFDNTKMITVIDTTADVTGSSEDGVFIKGRKVTLSPYRIGGYEVTQQLYSAIMDSNPSSHKGDMLPVETVSRIDCMKMCRELNTLFGYAQPSDDDLTIDISKEGFRLPTEAEWEFAARGGNPNAAAWDYAFSGSDTLDSYGWSADNADNATHDVGTKQPNALGIYDMSGNVSEWIADTFAKIVSGSVADPLSTAGGSFVQRGGGYRGLTDFCRVTQRTEEYQSAADKSCGFRLAISIR